MTRAASTIGVMARAPVPGRCKTRLAAAIGDDGAARLCRAMLLDTLAHLECAARASRLVVMAAPEEDGVARLREIAPARWQIIAQEGIGLGARLGQAFTTLAPGSSAVALVAADSPTAPWDEAAAALAALSGPRRAGMGPCEDGGYWLIAMTTLELGMLDGIAWSTDRVARQTRERSRVLGVALTEIGAAYDVDSPPDLVRLRAELAHAPAGAPRTAAVLREVR